MLYKIGHFGLKLKLGELFVVTFVGDDTVSDVLVNEKSYMHICTENGNIYHLVGVRHKIFWPSTVTESITLYHYQCPT